MSRLVETSYKGFRNSGCATMPRLSRGMKTQFYSEAEAAATLGITIARLHELLDEHIFTNGNVRPRSINFTPNDLLLLGYWCSGQRTTSSEVITMPKRR